MKIIIAGHPRGGTTWFAHLLRAHPKLRLVLEPFNHTRNQSMELHGLRGEIIHRLGEWRQTDTDVYGRIRRRLGQGVLDRYAAACCEYERNLPWVPSAALTEAQRQALADMVNVFFQATQADGFKAVWAGLKLPVFYEAVRALDPDTRLIFLQRDFDGVLASCHRRDFWYWFETPHRNLYAHRASLSPDCRLIADAFGDWTLPPQRLYTCWLVLNYNDIQDTEYCGRLVMRYSDLTQDCLTTVEGVLRYLGLEVTRQVQYAGRNTNRDASDNPYDARRDLSRLRRENEEIASAYDGLLREARRRTLALRGYVSRPELLEALAP